MKTQNVTAMGHCGIKIDLNLLDQYEVQHTLDRWEDLRAKKCANEEWRKKYYAQPYDERREWANQNEEPKNPEIDFFEEIKPIINFFKKIAFQPTEAATIFDEEKKEENKEAE